MSFLMVDDDPVGIDQTISDQVRYWRRDDDLLNIQVFSSFHVPDDLILLVKESADDSAIIPAD